MKLKQIFKHWNFMRIFRLFLGVSILFEGISSMEWGFLILGVLFTLMPIFNIGCCANGNCSTSPSTGKDDEQKEVIYEEIQ